MQHKQVARFGSGCHQNERTSVGHEKRASAQ
jgi:hypothetical protein